MRENTTIHTPLTRELVRPAVVQNFYHSFTLTFSPGSVSLLIPICSLKEFMSFEIIDFVRLRLAIFKVLILAERLSTIHFTQMTFEYDFTLV